MQIPIMTSFNNNFVYPARVSLFSLLINASKNQNYKLYTLHSDITDQNQKQLRDIVSLFPNASLEFINMNHKFRNIWPDRNLPFGFTKEVIYKINVASIFFNLDKMIITDVDVLYLDDLTQSFHENLDGCYYGGVKPVGKIMSYYDNYKNQFSADEIKRMSSIGGGYLVANLEEIRKHNHEQAMVNFLIKNVNRLIQLEQDVITYCSYGKLKYLPLKYMVCSYSYDLYKKKEDFKSDTQYTEEELRSALSFPIHLHYAGREKPWKGKCTKDNVWREYEKYLDQALKQGSVDSLIIQKNNQLNF